MEEISETIKKSIPQTSYAAKLYSIPKLHKATPDCITLFPTVSGVGTITLFWLLVIEKCLKHEIVNPIEIDTLITWNLMGYDTENSKNNFCMFTTLTISIFEEAQVFYDPDIETSYSQESLFIIQGRVFDLV